MGSQLGSVVSAALLVATLGLVSGDCDDNYLGELQVTDIVDPSIWLRLLLTGRIS